MAEEYINDRERYLQEQREYYFIAQYWDLVRITLFEVLNQNNRNELIEENILIKEVINLQNLVMSLPIKEQMFFFQSEPLYVAVEFLWIETREIEVVQIAM